MEKITSVGYKNVSIPIHWGLNISDIDWHNAVVMATIMSRRMDVSRLWDGTIYIDERIKDIMRECPKRYTTHISDMSQASCQRGNNSQLSQSISDIKRSVGRRYVDNYIATPRWRNGIKLSEPGEGYTQIRLVFESAIRVLGGGQPNINAFNAWGVVGEDLSVMNIRGCYIDPQDSSVVVLQVESYANYVGMVYTSYSDATGNLVDNVSGEAIRSFVTYFNKGGE